MPPTGKPQVFVACRMSNLDLTPALWYGELHYVAQRFVYADEYNNDGTLPCVVIERMARAVEVFRPATDYLLIAGDHAQMLQLSAMLVVRYRHIRALRYDRMARGYVPISIQGYPLTSR